MEGCVDGTGERRLLRFTTQTANHGTADLPLGRPRDTSFFSYSSCHHHYHFEAYANYRLLDAAGGVAATGHKQAFCLMDLIDLLGTCARGARYDCAFQGIQSGWADAYVRTLDCQWIDITGVPAGTYTLEVHVNPDRVIEELDYENNVARVPVTIP